MSAFLSMNTILFSIMILKITTTTVQAKRSVVSSKILESEIIFPIEMMGWRRTSAAIPAFHAIPSEALRDAKKYGEMLGI